MEAVCKRLAAGEDWQRVGVEELRPLIPEHDDDLGELNEILCEAESRIDEAAFEDEINRHPGALT